jgi:hypothetical protein
MLKPDLKFEKKTRLELIVASLVIGFSAIVSYQYSGLNDVLATAIYNVPSDSMLAAAAAAQGISNLTYSEPATRMVSQNYRVSGTDVLSNVPIEQFNLKAQSANAVISSIKVALHKNEEGTWPSTIYLYSGSTLLQSRAVALSTTSSATSTMVVFNFQSNGPVIQNSDIPTTYTISVDFPANTKNGTHARSRVIGVNYRSIESPASITPKVAYGHVGFPDFQYVYTKAARITLAGAPTITAANATVPTGTSTVVAVFPITICAMGGNVVLPGVSDGDAVVTFSNGVEATTANTVFTVIPANKIADGACASATITAKSKGFAPGSYNAALTSIKWNAGNGTTTQKYGLENFKTVNPAIQN